MNLTHLSPEMLAFVQYAQLILIVHSGDLGVAIDKLKTRGLDTPTAGSIALLALVSMLPPSAVQTHAEDIRAVLESIDACAATEARLRTFLEVHTPKEPN